MTRPEPSHAGVRPISSLQNERVKLIRSLQMRKARRDSGLFVAEGISVLLTARAAGWSPLMVLFLAGSAEQKVARELLGWATGVGAECLEVTPAVLAKVAAKDNPQTMLGVFTQQWADEPSPPRASEDAVWIALEAIRDPGNLGTIIRTADAVGASGVMLIGTSCDPYAHEAVRASMGSIFNVVLVRLRLERFLAWAEAWSGDMIGTSLSADADFRAVVYRPPTLLVMGSEGPGLSPAVAAACSRLVKIPMAGRLDSLNLAVATGLMLYEIRRDRLRL
jgi:RNA methyltransferase, TrmH family